jgi:hypothetical protein
MVAFLLFCILLCLCPPLRRAVGLLFWILVLAIVWNWPSDQRPASGPPDPVPAAVEPSAVIDELPVPYGKRRDLVPEVGTGEDFGPRPFVGPRQPRPYRQQ